MYKLGPKARVLVGARALADFVLQVRLASPCCLSHPRTAAVHLPLSHTLTLELPLGHVVSVYWTLVSRIALRQAMT